jgi:hypothetical protein
MSAPLVQRIADQTADVEASPAPVASSLPTASSGPVEAGGSHGFDQPLPVAPLVTSLTTDHGEGLGSATGESVPATGSAIGGLISAPSTALPVVARLTSDEPYSPASPAPSPRMSTETAALVPHRPPLAVRSDLSSAVAPPPPVQRLSFPDPGDATPGPRSDAPAAVQRMPATPGAAVPNRLAESPVTHSSSLRTVFDERPMGPGLVPTGGATRRMDPIPVQRRATGQLAVPAANPQTILTAGRSGEHASATSQTIGQAQSFATMFATASGPAAAEPEDNPGYTTVQLQTAAEPSGDTPPADEPTAGPTAQRQVETAAPAPSPAAPAASPAGAPPTGAAAADLDEMARRLFEPLSARLRAELWLDRERAGLVTDARH